MKPLTHEEIIKRPIAMTEKSATARDAFDQYTFEVDRRANKLDIRDAVEALFKVDVAAVNTSNYRGKFRRMGRGKGTDTQLEEGRGDPLKRVRALTFLRVRRHES